MLNLRTSGLKAFRSQEVGVVHIFHPVRCDPSLDPKQYKMCLGSKASTFASTMQLAELWLEKHLGVRYNQTVSWHLNPFGLLRGVYLINQIILFWYCIFKLPSLCLPKTSDKWVCCSLMFLIPTEWIRWTLSDFFYLKINQIIAITWPHGAHPSQETTSEEYSFWL